MLSKKVDSNHSVDEKVKEDFGMKEDSSDKKNEVNNQETVGNKQVAKEESAVVASQISQQATSDNNEDSLLKETQVNMRPGRTTHEEDDIDTQLSDATPLTAEHVQSTLPSWTRYRIYCQHETYSFHQKCLPENRQEERRCLKNFKIMTYVYKNSQIILCTKLTVDNSHSNVY